MDECKPLAPGLHGPGCTYACMGRWQGLTLVHIPAQPEPVSDTKHTLDTL